MSDLNMTQTTLPAIEQPRAWLSRLNLVLIAAVLVQALLVAWVYWPRNTATGGEPLLADVTTDEITRLRIADTNDNVVDLERTDEGWTLANTDGYPANSEKISTTLSSLVGLTTDRLVTSTPGSHGRLQVAEDNYVRQITLTTPDGDHVIYLGSSAGAGATHVRLGGDDATYLTGELASWEVEARPNSWINTSYVSVPQEEVVSMTLQNASGTLTFVRDDENEWTLQDRAAEEEILSANISTLVTRATGVTLIEPLGQSEQPEYGMDAPLATLTLQTENEDGETEEYTLTLGAKDDDTNSYYFKASNSPFYVRIASYTGDEFANKARADFLPQPAEESAAEETDAGEADSEGASPVLPDAAGAVTETAAVTATQTVTAAEPVTASEEITESQEITETESVTPTTD